MKIKPVTSTPLLAVDKINKYYGGLVALQDISLDILQGEVLALVGDNGAGKSTLVKTLSGAQEPDSGEIRIGDQVVSMRSPRDASAFGIATLYQDLGLVGSLNVFENVFLGREITRSLGPLRYLDKKAMRNKTIALLESLAIDMPRLNDPVVRMSGGQRQCVAISRLLLDEVRLIIMDEPMAALGVAEGARVLELINRLREQGVSVLIISHNLEHVFSIADRIAVLKNGRLIGVVSPTEVTREEVVRMITMGELSTEQTV